MPNEIRTRLIQSILTKDRNYFFTMDLLLPAPPVPGLSFKWGSKIGNTGAITIVRYDLEDSLYEALLPPLTLPDGETFSTIAAQLKELGWQQP